MHFPTLVRARKMQTRALSAACWDIAAWAPFGGLLAPRRRRMPKTLIAVKAVLAWISHLFWEEQSGRPLSADARITRRGGPKVLPALKLSVTRHSLCAYLRRVLLELSEAPPFAQGRQFPKGLAVVVNEPHALLVQGRADNRQAPRSGYRSFHHARSAAAAGIEKTRRKMGASSAMEYPVFLTPRYRLIAAPMNQRGGKTSAAVAVPGVPPTTRPTRADAPSNPKPWQGQ